MRPNARVAVLTTGRQDFGILRSTLTALRDAPAMELVLLAGGMHLRERFGRTIEHVRAAGFAPERELDFVGEPPAPAADAARALGQVAEALEALRPDCLLLAGDRHETLAAGVAATLARVPIVHLHGGEESEGAVDNAMRHALTKLSHLHLVSTALHARRVLQMGETPDSVVVVGAPGLDNAHRTDLPDRGALERRLGTPLRAPVVVVTMHPATLGGDPVAEVSAVAAAMERVPATYVITQANADHGGERIRAFWTAWASGRTGVALVEALGDSYYWTLLREAAAMLGNSSSGIIEAPALGLPVVNVGDRQRGRAADPMLVRHVPADADAIARALAAALAAGPGRAGAEAGQWDGRPPAGPAAPRIVAALAAWEPPSPPRKAFHLLAASAP